MSSDFFARGGGWVLGQSVLMLLVLALGPLCPGRARPGGLTLLAGVCLVLGALFGIGGAWVLGRNRTIFPRPNAGSRLVRHGVYRWVRHPLYTSLMLLSLGWAAWWASGPTLLAGGALAVFLDRKARREEAWLRAAFPEYADYARQVRRFVPGIY
jgi:protein-S-isoprenylcysteine O-methyltransferase Ste14